ncbi:TniQ family protein [Anaerobacillus sp. CMMVII]|uniref:TniQ family protein n=1 Tax=Anaerobacillus sp. CMMVII TaxID=2755588 RepID=UPI0021B81522|nr:TniQ family protein [Anaerobacillus sp. CMMVII]MCT8140270.1 TniQ family protein [Anaerobacillus sp. CMMVII]
MSVNISFSERSQLYNVEPIGIGTANVESLTGYISRISNLHCFKTGDLISKVITPIVHKNYLSSIAERGGDGFYKSAAAINGTCNLAQDFVNVLERLTTRDDLRAITLLNISHLVPTRGLLRKTKAWCPRCYHQDTTNNEVVYERLLWNFQAVSVCVYHDQKLSFHCPCCDNTIPVITRNSRAGFCSNCETWLGGDQVKAIEEELSIAAKRPVILISEILSTQFFWFDVEKNRCNSISSSLSYYIKKYFNDDKSKAAKYIGVPKSTFTGWYKGESLPQIKSLVLICMKLGVTIVEFLQRSEAHINTTNIDISMPEGSEKVRYDHVKIKGILEGIIENCTPISVKKVAELIGCDRKLLYVKYREVCEVIKNNYIEHLQKRKKNEIRRN